jgi:cytochrome c-type biogenesis protein CcmE
MTRKQKRLATIAAIGVVLLTAVLLVMTALRDQIVFFYTPTEILADGKGGAGQRIRLGGLVQEGSVVRQGDKVSFAITDTENAVAVSFSGLLPDLFREGQGVVTEGTLAPDGTFAADTVLAKHDENYMPREVADALREKGVWRGQE